MTSPYVTEMAARAHETELRAQAGRYRLAALATCCRPSSWAQALLRGGQAVARLRPAHGTTAACCEPA